MIPITTSGKHGAAAYQEQLRNSRQYLEYLLDRSAADEDLSTDEGRRSFLGKMLTVAARIPDAAQRDQFADRLSHKARITEEVVRAEIRKAAVQRQTNVERGRAPGSGHGTGQRCGTGPDLGPDASSRRSSRGGPARAGRRPIWRDWPRPGSSGRRDPCRHGPRRVITRCPDRASKYRRSRAGRRKSPGRPAPPADAADCARTLKRLRFEPRRAAGAAGNRPAPGRRARTPATMDELGAENCALGTQSKTFYGGSISHSRQATVE